MFTENMGSFSNMKLNWATASLGFSEISCFSCEDYMDESTLKVTLNASPRNKITMQKQMAKLVAFLKKNLSLCKCARARGVFGPTWVSMDHPSFTTSTVIYVDGSLTCYWHCVALLLF